jgi:ORF6N domain
MRFVANAAGRAGPGAGAMSTRNSTPPAAPVAAPVPGPLSIGEVAQRIQLIRSQRVVLDTDLAAFYGETTKRFNQQVNRNLARFPGDFMFQLSQEEFASLRLQSATLKSGRGQHRKYLPYVFTEHGAIMAATLLNSPRATALSVYVVRAFVELRGLLASNRELAVKVHSLERKVSVHERNIAELVDEMAKLLAAPTPMPAPKRPIGFVHPKEGEDGAGRIGRVTGKAVATKDK